MALQQIDVPQHDFEGDASESDLCKAMAKARELEIYVYDQLLAMHQVRAVGVGSPTAARPGACTSHSP